MDGGEKLPLTGKSLESYKQVKDLAQITLTCGILPVQALEKAHNLMGLTLTNEVIQAKAPKSSSSEASAGLQGPQESSS
jgi:hypothetical protein